MGLLGKGHGYLGSAIRYNKSVRYAVIWFWVLVLLWFFSAKDQDPLLMPITIAVGIVFTIVNSKT